MHVHFLDTVLRPYFYTLATSKREMDASLNVIGHRSIYIFKKRSIYFLSPKRKMGRLQKEKRKKRYQGVWQLVSRCVLVNGPLGNWELLKEIDSPA